MNLPAQNDIRSGEVVPEWRVGDPVIYPFGLVPVSGVIVHLSDTHAVCGTSRARVVTEVRLSELKLDEETVWHAHCARNGEIHVRLSDNIGDPILLASAPKLRLDNAISSIARLAYDNETWMVPGVPEAETAEEAGEALRRFQAMIEEVLS